MWLQRIMKYPLLISELLKAPGLSSVQRGQLSRAQEAATELAISANQAMPVAPLGKLDISMPAAGTFQHVVGPGSSVLDKALAVAPRRETLVRSEKIMAARVASCQRQIPGSSPAISALPVAEETSGSEETDFSSDLSSDEENDTPVKPPRPVPPPPPPSSTKPKLRPVHPLPLLSQEEKTSVLIADTLPGRFPATVGLPSPRKGSISSQPLETTRSVDESRPKSELKPPVPPQKPTYLDTRKPIVSEVPPSGPATLDRGGSRPLSSCIHDLPIPRKSK
jgi:hypothetical protein